MPPILSRSGRLKFLGFDFGQEAGDQKDDADFREFGDLQVDSSGQGDPAGGAERAFADDQHGDQEDDGRDVHRIDVLHHGVVIEVRDQPHKEKARADVGQLFPPTALPDGIVGGAVDLEDAERADQEDDREHGPVDVFAADFEHRYGFTFGVAGLESSGLVGSAAFTGSSGEAIATESSVSAAFSAASWAGVRGAAFTAEAEASPARRSFLSK